jgi:hypothetical protein
MNLLNTVHSREPDFLQKLETFLVSLIPLHGDSSCRCRPIARQSSSNKKQAQDDSVVQEPQILSTNCKTCAQDILTRAQAGEAHNHAMQELTSAHTWLLNIAPGHDFYENAPQLKSTLSSNIDGFTEAQLERIEQYWLDHQLTSPINSKNEHTHCCAPIGSWQRSQKKAEIESKKDGLPTASLPGAARFSSAKRCDK